jgi:hypothetical protein
MAREVVCLQIRLDEMIAITQHAYEEGKLFS